MLLHWLEKNELLSMSIVAEQFGLAEGSKDNEKKLIPLEIEGLRLRLRLRFVYLFDSFDSCFRLFNGCCIGKRLCY